MNDAKVDVEVDDTEVTVRISGDIDLANADAVADAVNRVINNTTTAVRLELGELNYVDSAGMRVLFDLATRLPTLQIALVIFAPAESRARRVLELSGLAGVVPLEPPVR